MTRAWISVKAFRSPCQISAALDVLSRRKFIIAALSRSRFDNTQLLTSTIMADSILITWRKYSLSKYIVYEKRLY
jgi:hypothetical protein